MWSRKGYVQVQYDTTRVPGQPIQLTPRYGTWSDQQVDCSYQPINMADHVPTTDDRFQQFTSVWTNQLSDKSVWTTRAAFLKFNTVTGVGLKQPWEYDTQSPVYWSGNTVPGTEDNPYLRHPRRLPDLLASHDGRLDDQERFLDPALEAAHREDRRRRSSTTASRT